MEILIFVAAIVGLILVIIGLKAIPSYYNQMNLPKDVENIKEFKEFR